MPCSARMLLPVYRPVHVQGGCSSCHGQRLSTAFAAATAAMLSLLLPLLLPPC